ncbi:SocA family protein [Haematospirillum jordaniae]|uniref:Panacea domain-containing protein n=1 Tax=Haematospirillum jordaniae TaxID=1549855 RepID=UPI0014332C84|nr:type II toxin-antitoxin system antitoxin SocA domain-containing protein [Haematospirillum jordaniae]NKD44994.1 SocA family protein [Haematospirillum jordaniae]NKD92716.1 SocA family protein [Haematospirillum jordaniae]
MKSAIEIADYILRKADSVSDTITPMQILKLVYLCHGWMLGLYGRQLIKEDIEAWRYGPVIRDLYDAVKDYRSQAITKFLLAQEVSLDPAEKNIVDQVYEKYGQYSGPALSRLTHMTGSPWDITYTLLGQSKAISNDLIEDYFKQQAQASQEAGPGGN